MKATHNPSTVDVQVTPADILRGAARYLQLHGWRQGALYTDAEHTTDPPSLTPPACALGAIGMAAFGHRIPDHSPVDADAGWRDYQHASDALDDYLTLTGAKTTVPELYQDCRDGISVGDWNDAPGRTLAEVTATLNAAADAWDRQHTPPGGDLP
jgi:uncharacterized protein DUF6197